MRANEALAAFMYEPDALEDRRLFVRNLGWLLSQTREGVVSCELVSEKPDEEYVAITFKGEYQRLVNVHMDSYAAIVRDVAKAIR